MDVLVVGGGIIGASVAVQCARRGMAVCLCERGPLAAGASGLELALLPADVDVREYLELHHFTGGSFFLDRSPPEDWPARRIDTRAAVSALLAEARLYGAEIRTFCDVKTVLVRGGRVRGAVTDAGELLAPTTVVAAGSESWRVCRSLRRHVPVRRQPVDLLVTEPAPFELERPIVAGTAWIAQDEAGRLVAADPDQAVPALPELSGVPVLERRTLDASVTADGVPLEGPLPGVDGLVLACGHGLQGIALAPAVGARVAVGIADGSWEAA